MMAIDWLNPSQDILDARQAGRNDLQDEVEELEYQYSELQAEVKKLRDALEFYGNRKNWQAGMPFPKKMFDDTGKIAREALKK